MANVQYVQPQPTSTDLFTQAFMESFKAAQDRRLEKMKLDLEKTQADALISYRDALIEQGQREYELSKRKEAREQQRFVMDMVTGVRKAEVPISTLPQNVQEMMIKRPQFNTTGLNVSPRAQEIMGNIPHFAQFTGTPQMQRKFTPGETLEQAQAREMEIYAAQQQAINPYKDLLKSKVDILENPERAEELTDIQKIILGIANRQDATDEALGAYVKEALKSMKEGGEKGGGRIRVKRKSNGETGTIEINEFDPKIYEKL